MDLESLDIDTEQLYCSTEEEEYANLYARRESEDCSEGPL